MPGKVLSVNNLLERMAECCRPGAGEGPPFTLILGSGFSWPIVPTTSQIVRTDLAWWKRCRQPAKKGSSPKVYENYDEKSPEVLEEAKAFWTRVCKLDGAPKIALGVDGLPENASIAEAYQFALSPDCSSGLSSPHMVRRYFTDLVRRAGRKLNPAHLYLAALIAEYPRLFGTIFTTNFDPLLQRSLQLVNVPYFVSDRPETLQHPDDDGATDAIHLIYAHGSIYRYLLLNSPDEIKEYAEKNHSLLQEYFRKHAVLIIGYSGWNDAVTKALKKVERFDHNLYWCAREESIEKSSLSADAKEILNGHANAFFVPIENADKMMVQLHQRLAGHALPGLFRAPIQVVREQLDRCDMKGVKLPGAKTASDNNGNGSEKSGAAADELDLGQEVESIRKRLDGIQQVWAEPGQDPSVLVLALQVRDQFAKASDLYSSGKYSEALPFLEFVIEHEKVLSAGERALAFLRRGYIYGQKKQEVDMERALADYGKAIEIAGTSAETRAKALINRGFIYGQRKQKGDSEREFADYSEAIEMVDTPVAQRGIAFFNRGAIYGDRKQEGDLELALADYGKAIEMAGTSAETRAKALLNRSFIYGKRRQAGDAERAIADCGKVIEMIEMPAELRAKAVGNRGATYATRNQEGDVELALADFNKVLEIADAPKEQHAKALINRARVYSQRKQAGDTELELADYRSVLALPGVPSGLKDIAQRLIEGYSQKAGQRKSSRSRA